MLFVCTVRKLEFFNFHAADNVQARRRQSPEYFDLNSDIFISQVTPSHPQRETNFTQHERPQRPQLWTSQN